MDNREKLYEMIAENIRSERKKLCISQEKLAEKADLSVDTVKNLERGRQGMNLDTYLRIVQALEINPFLLLNGEQPEQYIERFVLLMSRRDEGEIEFILHAVEQLLKLKDNYLKE